jgi:flagellar basal body-associated protein FliL
MFTGIGRLRIPLEGADGQEALLITSVVFPYNAGDIAFKEELSAEIVNFRAKIRSVLGELSANDDLLSNEASLKNTLKQILNADLHLGKIEEIYFAEFLVVE